MNCSCYINYQTRKKFTLKEPVTPLYEVTEQQLAWLLAGLDWITISYAEAPESQDMAYTRKC